MCKMYEIVNKQVKFLTSQYIGTCKSAYTKGCNLNWTLTSNMERQEYIDTITELKAMISSLKQKLDTEYVY